MSKRSRRKRKAGGSGDVKGASDGSLAADASAIKWPEAWRRVTGVLGILILCATVMVCDLLGRTFFFWLSRANYVPTELEVTQLDGDPESGGLFGIVAATGEEIRVGYAPTELYEDQFGGAIRTRISPAAARGKRIGIWYAANHTSFFSSPRVVYISEYGTLPSGMLVLSLAAATLSLIAVGLVCIVWGFRRG